MHRTVGHHHGLIIRVRSAGSKNARRSRERGKERGRERQEIRALRMKGLRVTQSKELHATSLAHLFAMCDLGSDSIGLQAVQREVCLLGAVRLGTLAFYFVREQACIHVRRHAW